MSKTKYNKAARPYIETKEIAERIRNDFYASNYAIENAKPKVSEDDQKAANKIVLSALNKYGAIYPTQDLVQRIADALTSVRAAAVKAERERIKREMETLYRNVDLGTEEGEFDYAHNESLDGVLQAIDGQPVDGGGE